MQDQTMQDRLFPVQRFPFFSRIGPLFASLPLVDYMQLDGWRLFVMLQPRTRR